MYIKVKQHLFTNFKLHSRFVKLVQTKLILVFMTAKTTKSIIAFFVFYKKGVFTV